MENQKLSKATSFIARTEAFTTFKKQQNVDKEITFAIWGAFFLGMLACFFLGLGLLSFSLAYAPVAFAATTPKVSVLMILVFGVCIIGLSKLARSTKSVVKSYIDYAFEKKEKVEA